MGVFNNWPYTDVHQLNLDFILEVAKEAQESLENIEQTTADAEAAKQEAVLASTRAIRAAGDAEDIQIQVAQYYQNIIQIGTPIVVQDSSDMTQYNRVYLYTGTEIAFEFGHWYYYDDNTGEWTDGGEYGVGSGISANANNILKYILEHVAYTVPGMQTYINALYQALAQGGGGSSDDYTILNALVHVTNSNESTSINDGDSYTATLAADNGYIMGTVTVTMGGVDITSSVYANGNITISNVTGDIIISAIAIEMPYITDGLIMYLDGINNTKHGHDTASTSWEDLAGNYDITTITDGTWDENGLIFTGLDTQLAKSTNIFANTSAMTIEMVLAPSATQTEIVGSFNISSANVSKRFSLFSDNTIAFVGTSGQTYSNPGNALTTIKTLTAIYSDYTVTKGFANNTQLSLSGNSHSLRRSINNNFVNLGVADPVDPDKYPFAGKIMALRVYNRALTDAERNQNFNIDNQRFGLGL